MGIFNLIVVYMDLNIINFKYSINMCYSGMGYMGEMREDPLQHCWLPIGLKVTLTNDGRTVVENISKEVLIIICSIAYLIYSK